MVRVTRAIVRRFHSRTRTVHLHTRTPYSHPKACLQPLGTIEQMHPKVEMSKPVWKTVEKRGVLGALSCVKFTAGTIGYMLHVLLLTQSKATTGIYTYAYQQIYLHIDSVHITMPLHHTRPCLVNQNTSPQSVWIFRSRAFHMRL